MVRFIQAFALTALASIAAVNGEVPRGGSTTTVKPITKKSGNTLAAKADINFVVGASKILKKNTNKDSLQAFGNDIGKVMHELRSEKNDPTVSPMFHSEKRPTFAVTWTHKMWEQHSKLRFVNAFLYWHQSALMKSIAPQLATLMAWTAIVIHLSMSDVMPTVNFPMTSLSLVSGFVASLLALRTNQGISRLLDARQSFGKVVFYTRDMASIISNFLYDKDPELALKLARHVATFPWLLKNFLRGKEVSGTDEDLIRTLIPSRADADYIMQQRKMPVAVVMRLRQALAHCTHKHLLSTAEEMAMDHTIQAMDLAVMATERIVASPIPTLFTAHASRLMAFYLAFLPVALRSSGGMTITGVFVTVFAVGYAMLGLDELSHLVEQPFKVCPLYHLCKNSMTDVADAICVRPPSLAIENDNSTPYVPPVEPNYRCKKEGYEGLEL